jgi:aldehyde:ferredoxin oxidoreductase
MVKITEMIAKREGFGEILAEGSKKASEIIGRGTEEYLITSKGQEAPAHMPQVKRSLSVIYAANPFGADHESSEHDPGYKAYPERMKEIGLTNPQEKLALNKEMMRFAMITQHLSSAVDSISVCAFIFGASFQLYTPEQLVQTINAVMGWNVDMKEILEVGERRLNMLRAFNSREGVGRESDTLPKKMFKRPLKGGRSDGYVLNEEEWEAALEDYYRLCDWDVETGHPSLKKMESLGLGWVVAENNVLSKVIN